MSHFQTKMFKSETPSLQYKSLKILDIRLQEVWAKIRLNRQTHGQTDGQLIESIGPEGDALKTVLEKPTLEITQTCGDFTFNKI